jgi:hypothetical protein
MIRFCSSFVSNLRGEWGGGMMRKTKKWPVPGMRIGGLGGWIFGGEEGGRRTRVSIRDGEWEDGVRG